MLSSYVPRFQLERMARATDAGARARIDVEEGALLYLDVSGFTRLTDEFDRRGPEGAEAQKIAKDLRDWVGKEIGPIAKPKDIRFGDNLPKTRSGKIMRRLLRSIAKGEAITQDVSTLENPAILEQLKVTL